MRHMPHRNNTSLLQRAKQKSTRSKACFEAKDTAERTHSVLQDVSRDHTIRVLDMTQSFDCITEDTAQPMWIQSFAEKEKTKSMCCPNSINFGKLLVKWSYLQRCYKSTVQPTSTAARQEKKTARKWCGFETRLTSRQRRGAIVRVCLFDPTSLPEANHSEKKDKCVPLKVDENNKWEGVCREVEKCMQQ